MLSSKLSTWIRTLFRQNENPNQAPTSLQVEELEDRQLLSSVIQADYADDFAFETPDSNWQYLWNAPSDWTGTSSEDASDQRFGDPQHYVSLLANGRSYRPVGESPVDLSEPDRNLRLSKTGGRVGAGFQQNESNNRVSRFAIAAWTVQEDGFHAIRDSHLTTHAASKGIDLIIHVNDEDPIFRRRLQGTDRAFNASLGYLEAGDIVYFGFGGANNDQGGTFRHDFSIVKLEEPGLTVIQSDGLTQVSEPGTSDTFTVVLDAKPVSGQRIVVNIDVDDPTELKTDRRRLYFNRSNWNIPQVVNVSGVNDDLVDGTTFTSITASINETLSNPEYLAVEEKSFVVTNFDNENLVPLRTQIASGINRGLNEIVIVPGEYELTPVNERSAHLYIDWAEDVTIVADDANVVATELNTGILLRNSSDVTLSGLTYDHSRLPFTQGTITDFGSDRSWVEVEIHEGYELPKDGDETRIVFHDPTTLVAKSDTLSRFGASVVAQAGRNFRINTFAVGDSFQVGDYVSLTLPITTPHAIWVQDSSRVKLSDITVNSSTSFAFFETLGDANEYTNLTVTPGDKPEGATVERLLSSNYDGFHSKNASLGPKVLQSNFYATGDDGIAINGDYNLLVRNDGDSIVVAAKWRLTRFEAGDRIRIYNEATGNVSEATILNVELYEEEDLDFSQLRDQLLPDLQNPETQFQEGYRLTLSDPLPNVAGDLISNLDQSGAGYEVRDNVVENTRARGLVLKSPEGIVEGNRIENVSVTGILIAPESNFWMEGDFSSLVVIRNNHLKNVGYFFAHPDRRRGGGIAVVADENRTIRGHRNLEIIDNLLERIEGPGITISNATGVRIEGNWLRETNRTDNKFGQGSAIWIDNSDSILLNENVIDRPGEFLDWPLTVTPTVSAVNDVTAFQFVDQPASIVERGIAYRGASGFGNSTIDSTRVALMPGQASSSANVSNFDRGLNRIIIDFNDLVRDSLSLNDFEFLVGNSTNPNEWKILGNDSNVPLPTMSTTTETNLTRVILDWPDNAIRNQWLQVTVKANGSTGLAEDDTFYFGSLVANTIDGNIQSGNPAVVNATDTSRVLQNLGTNTTVPSNFDIDRNGIVDGFDAALTRINYSNGNGLVFFEAPETQTFGRLQIQFTDDDSPDLSLVSPNSLSRQQSLYIESIFDRWEARLDPGLSVTERNERVLEWHSAIAERHTEYANDLESQGFNNSAKYWSMIALVERQFVAQLEAQPNVDFREVGQEWTI